MMLFSPVCVKVGYRDALLISRAMRACAYDASNFSAVGHTATTARLRTLPNEDAADLNDISLPQLDCFANLPIAQNVASDDGDNFTVGCAHRLKKFRGENNALVKIDRLLTLATVHLHGN
jgi:hypothetical protein